MPALFAALALAALASYAALVWLDRRRSAHRHFTRMQNVGR